MLQTALRRFLKTILGLMAGLLVLYFASASRGDAALYPAKSGEDVRALHVVDHGYHAGFVVEVAALAASGQPALGEIARRFGEYRWVEIGWGDEGFYRNAPTLGSVQIGMALRALFMPGNASVLHVVGLNEPPERAFAHSNIAVLSLSREGFARLAEGINATFGKADERGLEEPGLQDLGPGLYGPSRFYRARGEYSLISNCNHWISRLLRAAGVPASGLGATFSATLMEELRFRGGARMEFR